MADNGKTGVVSRRRRRELVCSHGYRGDATLNVTVLGRYGEVVVAEVSGEIDLRTAETLRTRLLELADVGFGRIVVDFGHVRFCDATGLGVLVAVRNRLRGRGGDLRLARVRPPQRRIFRITGLDRLFALHDSVEDAISEGQAPTAPSLG
ncbi:STAS domain-containing protein [Actinomadura alba]|uniref:STAS domain-containing protein n=1 Tax=Actinomadura alba TaxID=406431 RepID=UPI0031DC7AFC